MRGGRLRRFILTLGFGVILFCLGLGVLTTDAPDALPFVLTIVGFPTVGYLILLNRPGNGVGLGLLLMGEFMGLALAKDALVAWLDVGGGLVDRLPVYEAGFVSLILAVVLFPAGRPTTGFDRIYLRVVLLTATGALILMSLSPPVGGTPVTTIERLGVWMRDDGFVIVPAMIIVGIGSSVVRGVRSEGVERLQYKWFLVGAAVMVTSLIVVNSSAGEIAPIAIASAIGIQALPAAILVAVVRYRLYEIDRIVSRTVTYAVVVGGLALVFFAMATVVGTQVAQEPLFVAATTLAVAAVFNPLRRRVQVWVDRRFNRSRYDLERVMDDFARSLRDEVGENAVLEGWQGVVTATMQPVSVGVWVRE